MTNPDDNPNAEILSEFVTESRETLEKVEPLIIDLEGGVALAAKPLPSYSGVFIRSKAQPRSSTLTTPRLWLTPLSRYSTFIGGALQSSPHTWI
jgi:hypothetical protein